MKRLMDIVLSLIVLACFFPFGIFFMNLAIDDGDDTSIVSPFLMSAKLKVNFLIFFNFF